MSQPELSTSKRRAVHCLALALAAVLATLGVVLAQVPAPQALDLVPLVPIYYLEWHTCERSPLLLLVGSLLTLLVPAAFARLNWHFGQLGRYAVLLVEALLARCTWLHVVRGPRWQVPPGSLLGKVCVVTGCNAGIGYETALGLARAGAKVVFACRSDARAKAAMRRLVQEAKGGVEEGQLRFLQCDLCSLPSVRSFAEQLRQAELIPDILILNAGMMSAVRELSADGFDVVWAANHLGHFALAYQPDTLDFSEITSVRDERDRSAALARPYAMFPHYAGTKLANVLFAKELARRLEEHGSRRLLPPSGAGALQPSDG